MGGNWGELTLMWKSYPEALDGWHAYAPPADAKRYSRFVTYPGSQSCLGFLFYRWELPLLYGFWIPFWFPTAVSAALLWLVWRKTRPKPVGRAFPVEVTKPIGEQGGKAA